MSLPDKALLFFTLFLLVHRDTFAADDKAKDKQEENPAAAATQDTPAKARCETAISYLWQRRPLPAPPPARGVPQPAPEQAEPIKTFFRAVAGEGAAEPAAREALAAQIGPVLNEAMRSCSRERENESSCVILKLRDAGADYNAFDFQQRKALLDSIIGDCKNSLGRCLKAEAAEPSCTTAKPQEEPAEKAEEKPADKK